MKWDLNQVARPVTIIAGKKGYSRQKGGCTKLFFFFKKKADMPSSLSEMTADFLVLKS